MPWINTNRSIPVDNHNFNLIIAGLLFECPSTVKSREQIGVDDNGKKILRNKYTPVSVRNNAFRNRGIRGNLLTTILASIRKPLKAHNAYYCIENQEIVEDKIAEIIATTTLGDVYFDVIVMKKRSDMSETEALFYYIRNAFAHGDFEYSSESNENSAYYLLESKKDGSVKAQMRLKETTLIKILRLSKMPSAEITEMQKKKKILIHS